MGALVIALTLGVFGANLAQAQVTISYNIVAFTLSDRNGVASSRLTPLRLCPGEEGYVGVILEKTVNGVTSSVRGATATVEVQAQSPAVLGPVAFVGNLPDPPAAHFRFKALAPGTGFLIVDVPVTGEEATIPRPAILQPYLPVEVTGCYEAYTSGLGTQFDFDGKNMGGFNRPFLLSGSSNVGGVTAKGQNMFFIPGQREGPSPACPVHSCRGSHVFFETWSFGGAACSSYVSGRYALKFHLGPMLPGTIPEGDVEMSGTGQVFCGGAPGPKVDYEHSVGFLIAFRPRPPGP